MVGKVGQGGMGMNHLSAAPSSAPGSGVDLAAMGVEMDTTVQKTKTDSASPTEPQFGKVWNQIQAQYGAKAEKPREVKKQLGKDDFLRLMIMQMKYQDPSKPFEMDKMGAEMAQLSSMEQLQNLNQTMKQMLTRDQPMERMAMTSMIGKTVTVDRDRFPFTEGSSQPIKFNLPMDASRVTLTIVDQSGSPVVETDLGPQRKGEGGYLWDGKKANSLPAKSGNYTYRISAADASGNPMKVGNAANVRVVGVSFEGQKPVMLVGDPNSPDKVFMENVVRIIDHSGSTSALIPGAQSLAGAIAPAAQSAAPAAAQAQKNPGTELGNFFTFKKGVGSQPLDTAQLSAEDKGALTGYQPQATGFPNGLNSADTE